MTYSNLCNNNSRNKTFCFPLEGQLSQKYQMSCCLVNFTIAFHTSLRVLTHWNGLLEHLNGTDIVNVISYTCYNKFND